MGVLAWNEKECWLAWYLIPKSSTPGIIVGHIDACGYVALMILAHPQNYWYWHILLLFNIYLKIIM